MEKALAATPGCHRWVDLRWLCAQIDEHDSVPVNDPGWWRTSRSSSPRFKTGRRPTTGEGDYRVEAALLAGCEDGESRSWT